jgi:hypothetical protein
MAENTSPKPNTLHALAELKLPLIEQDYQSYFEATARNHELISQLRSLEVTLVSAISVALISRDTFPLLAFIPMYLFVLVFYLLDARTVAGTNLVQADALEVERKIQSANLSEFTSNIVKWDFGNTVAAKRTTRNKVSFFVKALVKPEVILWHGGLILAVTVLFLAVILGS